MCGIVWCGIHSFWENQKRAELDTRQFETEKLDVNKTSIVSGAREEREDVIIDNCGEVKAINKCVLLPLKGPYQRRDKTEKIFTKSDFDM